MTPRLSLREEATADTREAFTWYEARATGLGFDFLRALRATLAAVERAPQQFPITLQDIRRARLRRFPYSVYFVPLGSDLVVLAVMHDRRHPHRWQMRR